MIIGAHFTRPVQPSFFAGSGLRSPLDADDLTNQHKKNRVIKDSNFSNANQANKMEREIAKIRRRMLQQPPQPTQTILPFQVYQTDNNLNPVDNWRTFQMRDGLISGRSRYSTSNFALDPSSNTLMGNYENELVVVQDNQTAYSSVATLYIPFGGQVELSKTQDTLIVGIDGTGAAVGYNQFLCQPDPDPDTGLLGFSIFAEIIDSSTPVPALGFSSMYANLKGRMYQGSGVTAFEPFPRGNNIVPIAFFSSYNLLPFDEFPIQLGNLVNRIHNYAVSGGYGSNMNFLGDWTAQSLSGQLFYPGDTLTSSLHLYYRNTLGFTSVAPTGTDADWTRII